MNIEFKSNVPELQAVLDEISRKVQPAATATALNQTVAKIAKEARRDVARVTGVPQKHFTKRIKQRRDGKATARKPYARLWAGLWPMSVASMTPKPRQLKSGRVKYKTLPGDTIDPHAFVAKVTRNVTAFAREGAARGPLNAKTLDVGRHIKLRTYRILRKIGREEYERRFFQQMEGRTIKAMNRKGMKVL